MSVKFNQLVAKMPELLKALKSQPFLTRDNLVGIPERGVYVFYENGEAIYVGRSNRLKQRLKEHSQISSDRYSATLAFRIAKQEYYNSQKKGRRQTNEQLMKNSIFREKFEAAKGRIAKTRIRFVEIEDQVEQAMFEIYAALVLDTELNDFGTH